MTSLQEKRVEHAIASDIGVTHLHSQVVELTNAVEEAEGKLSDLPKDVARSLLKPRYEQLDALETRLAQRREAARRNAENAIRKEEVAALIDEHTPKATAIYKALERAEELLRELLVAEAEVRRLGGTFLRLDHATIDRLLPEFTRSNGVWELKPRPFYPNGR